MGTVLIPAEFFGPKAFEVLDSERALSPQRWIHDPGLHPQGFELRIDHRGVQIRYGADKGRRYAAQLLETITRSYGSTRGILIRDWPVVDNRRFMLDISRNRVPRRKAFAWLVDCLDSLRFTDFHIYVEHVYEFAGHERVWSGSGALSSDDLKWLDELCARHGINLVISTNCFGHMQRWLSHAEYRHRSECPEGSPSLFDPGARASPSCMAATTDNAHFCLDLIRELTSNVVTPAVHIGGDEPFDLGQGQSRLAVEHRGFASVYGEHMTRIINPLVDDGYEVQYWGDVVASHPAALEHLPASGCLPVVWHYEAPDDGCRLAMIPDGVRDAMGLPTDAHRGFRSRIGALADLGRPFGFAAATSNCNTLFGRWMNCRGNIGDAVETAVLHDVDDVAVTEWGDNGHLQPLAVAAGPLALCARALWTGSTPADTADAASTEVTSLLLGDGSGELGTRLRDLGFIAEGLGRRCFNASPVVEELIAHPITFASGELDRSRVRVALELLESTVHDFAAANLEGSFGSVAREDLHACARLALHGLARLASRIGLRSPTSDLAADFAEVVDLLCNAWRRSSREGGFQQTVACLSPPAS